MSLDERLRAARPSEQGSSFDLDAMLDGAMRAGHRRRQARRAAAAGGVALIVLLVSIPVVRNLARDEADIADRIQKEEEKRDSSPVPTRESQPGSRPGRSASTMDTTTRASVSGGGVVGVRRDSRAATPDRIAFVSAEPSTNIYVMALRGGAKKLLGPGADPDWSPDGKLIAYSRGRTDAGCSATTSRVDPPDPCDVWVMNADGSNQHRLAAGWSPDWSPDGKRIAYGAGQDRSEIHVMNADGSGSTRITDTPNTSPSTQGSNSPSWSPDGKQIAFSRRATCGGGCWTNHVYVVKPDGSGLRPLATNTEAVGPAWSPDGGRIAFVAQGDGTAEIFVVDVDDQEVRQLTHDKRGDAAMDNYDGHPAWSPDGRLAFVSDPDGPSGGATCATQGTDARCGAGGPAPPRLSLMNPDGSGVIDLGEGRMPDFAPRR